jgi:hypothetical protein
MPSGGATTVVTGIVIAPSGGAGGTVSVGLVIQPGEAGATGEAGDTGTSQGGTGPCGGHVCGSIISLGGSAGNAGAKP